MCTYIYSPGKTIQIDYASEFITIHEDGRSEVLVDFLVTNKSDDSLNQFTIIYPNVFFEVYVKGDEDSAVELTLKSVGEYDDLSDSLSDPRHQYNWVYNSPGCEMSNTPPNDLDFSVPDWSTYLGISLPNPADSTQTIEYKGILANSCELEPLPDLTATMWAVLAEINYSIFVCDVTQPIEKNVPRWFRFRFKGRRASFNSYKSFELFKRRAINRLHYEFQIFGPYDVRDRFITYLQSYKRDLDRNFRDNGINTKFKDAVRSLIYFIESSSLKTSTTHMPMWLIHVAPGVLGRLTDPNSDGEVKIAGFLPNVVIEGKNSIRVYEWKAGEPVTGDPTKEYKFSLLFHAKAECTFYAWLPWISLAIGLTALCSKLFGK